MYIKTNATESIKEYFQKLRVFLNNLLLFFRTNLSLILAFDFLCSFVSAVILHALNLLLSRLFVRITGISYLNFGNMAEFARNPFSYLFILMFLITATFFSLFEISGLLHAYSMAQIGRSADLFGMITVGLNTCRKTINPKNWPVILYLIVLLPITGILTLSSAGYKLTIPYFILQGIESNPSVTWIYYTVYCLLLIIELIYIFAIHIYVLEDVSFPEAMKRSRRLGKGKTVNTLVMMLVTTLLINFVINSVSSVVSINFAELVALFRKMNSVAKRSQKVGIVVYVVRQILKSLFAPALNCAAITVLFYQYVEEKLLLTRLAPHVFRGAGEKKEAEQRFLVIFTAILAVLVCFGIWHYRYLLEPVDKAQVCAHRGDNVHAPENTLPAYELSAAENLLWVETDVIQTRDGIVVCSHDQNLSRVTGKNVVVSTSTYEELQNYEMGSWLPGNFDSRVTVPKLEEVIQLAKDEDMSIQIELKPTVNDTNLEEEVIRLIHAYGMEDRSMVISLHTDSIRRIKELDPGITTAVCVYAAWEEFKDIPFTDNLSISDNAVTPDLVRQMHEAGMKVFCWTVDDFDAVQYLVSCGVDVIGTNDPMTIQEALDQADCRGGIFRLFHILMHTIASMDR